jgi:Mor family transcriptional regulator
MITETYRDLLLSTTPITRLTPTKHERNREIRRRHQQGESLSSLAQGFGITEQRVYQIVQGRRK